jgi:hypothetical protein
VDGPLSDFLKVEGVSACLFAKRKTDKKKI